MGIEKERRMVCTIGFTRCFRMLCGEESLHLARSQKMIFSEIEKYIGRQINHPRSLRNKDVTPKVEDLSLVTLGPHEWVIAECLWSCPKRSCRIKTFERLNVFDIGVA